MELIDLCESIWYDIFKYLQDDEIYFTLRKVCRRIKRYADAYVQIDCLFLIVHGCRPSSSRTFSSEVVTETITSKIVYVFRRFQHPISSLSSKFLPPLIYHHRSDTKNLTTTDHFGITLNNRIIVGNFCVTETRSKIILNSHKFYEYNQYHNHWGFLSTDVNDSSKTIGSMITRVTFPNYGRVQFHERGLQLLQFSLEPGPNPHNLVRITTLKYKGIEKLDYKIWCGAISHAGSNEIFLIQPNIFDARRINNKNNSRIPKMSLLGGILSETNNEVLWRKLEINIHDIGLIELRYHPICFKLKDNIYITGGQRFRGYINAEECMLTSCDRYNLSDGRYHKTDHFLPSAVSIWHSFVVTIKKGTMALIIFHDETNINSRVITFTEDSGFVELPNVFISHPILMEIDTISVI